MAVTRFASLILVFSLYCLQLHAAAASYKPTDEFIRSKCNSTEYPQLCIASLSSYAPTVHNNPVQLAGAALSVSLKSARSTSAMMARLSTSNSARLSLRDAEAVRDCVEGLGDSVEYLRDSLKEMGPGSLKGKEAMEKLGDVQTWVSTALTDENACMDVFGPQGDKKVSGAKGAARGQVVRVAQLTSNALALISGLGSTN